MPYLLAGPFVALVGIMAVFFVLRRKSVEKRSMYSARRSQIEHKVRAARQRTLAPRSRQKPAEETIPGATEMAPAQMQPTMAYQAPAYEAPPVAPAAPVAPPYQPQEAPEPSPWDVPAAAAAAAPAYDYPVAPPAEPAYTPPAYAPPSAEPDTFSPAPEVTPMQPSEQAWTPAPAPAEPAVSEAATTSASATSAGGWSIVSPEKESAASAPDGKKKDKGGDATGSAWSLASGAAPGMADDEDEPQAKRPAGTIMAVAQYAVLVVGLVMVLIGVLVMVANAPVK